MGMAYLIHSMVPTDTGTHQHDLHTIAGMTILIGSKGLLFSLVLLICLTHMQWRVRLGFKGIFSDVKDK